MPSSLESSRQTLTMYFMGSRLCLRLKTETILREVFRHLALVAATAREITERLNQTGNTEFSDSYAKTLTNIGRMLSISNFHQQWEQFKAATILPADLRVLELISIVLSKSCPEPCISEDALNDLLKKVNTLYEDVFASELDSPLKLTLLDRLEKVRRAIHDYKIKGSK